MTSRQQIEKIKRQFQASLEQNSPRYRRAVIRQIDYLYRRYGQDDLAGFLDVLDRLFDVPGAAKSSITRDLIDSQRQISELWREYYEESGVLFPDFDKNDFEKMSALYKVDFSKIKSGSREVIMNEIRRIARSGAGYDVLRSRLLKRSLGDAESRTLANTSLAQFDNAMMFEFAQQGGIEQFKYDGVLHENTRLFCREHLGKKFTIDEIRQMDNGQGIPVETSCGGYNCTHWWTPVIDDLSKRNVAVRKKKTQEGSTAIGIPVSRALDVIARGRLKKSIDYGIQMIDKVHGDGDLALLPIRQSSSRSTAGGFGENKYNHEPVDIHVSKNSNHPELTVIHEIGHYLDHSGIGIRKQMSSATDPIMSEWREAVKSSKAFKGLQEVYDRRYIEYEINGQVQRHWNSGIRDYFDYLMSDEELWARSYSQFIAHKTGDAKLKEQVSQFLKDRVEYNRHWSDDDFTPIASAIEKMFKQIGWMI
jgi:hypothetical protein